MGRTLTSAAEMPLVLRLGTRTSRLARAQVALVAGALARLGTPIAVEEVGITSRGDGNEAPFASFEGPGIFTHELEAALTRREIDAAVHSMKDLPASVPRDFALFCLPRAEARDGVITRSGVRIGALPRGSRVGTSSARRAAYLRRSFPHLEVVPVRGNVDTRLRKLERGEVDALVLAAAGVDRLGLPVTLELLDLAIMIPAPAQGAIAIETMPGSKATAVLGRLDDPATRLATSAERAFLAAFGQGCQLPVGAHAHLSGDEIHLTGGVFEGDSYREASASGRDPEELGRRLAGQIRGR